MSTRIVDLPENITMQPSMTVPTSFASNADSTPTNYIPINVHPNPYGISAQNPIMPNPAQQNMDQMTRLNDSQMAELQNTPPRRLPSRDIPMDKTGYLQDEEVQPNYIPRPMVSSDYIREHTDTVEKKHRENEKKKYRESRVDEFLTEFQVPLLICLLYFIFQLPGINTLIFKKFSFLAIYNDDGNFNMYGLILKSLLFGFLFYSLQKIVTFISEI